MKPTQRYKKTRRFVSALALLLTVAMIGSTWAYTWTQELNTKNEYQFGKYSTRLQEEFQAPDDWQPGVNVQKEVTVENEGTVPIFVKVTVGQEWLRRENVYDSQGNVVPPAQGKTFPLQFSNGGTMEDAAQINWSENVVVLEPPVTMIMTLSAGIMTDALPKVSSLSEAQGKWLLMDPEPNSRGELTLYYIGVLDENDVTPKLLDSVTMNPLIQPRVTQKDTIWNKTDEQWETTETINDAPGYENARYTLTVTMDTVQATQDALQEMFATDSVTEQAVISYLETMGIQPVDTDTSYDDTVTEKLLYLNASDGKLTFTPVRNGTENWFMSHLNMLPGGAYTDTLSIENRTNKSYDLFMQVVPLTQDKQLDLLLEYIHMKVYNGDTLIYDGTAMGGDYTNSINDLQEVIRLGNYAAKATTALKVELELDKDTPIELSGLLSKIDWKFMTLEIPTDNGGGSSGGGTGGTSGGSSSQSGPKTGDNTDNSWYVITMVTGGLMLMSCLIYLFKTREKKENAASWLN